jgi:hypothetical protein
MEISQAFSTCSSALPQLAYLTCSESSPMWIDLLKTLSATFIGAVLAFGTNLYFQSRQRKNDQRSAGNLALATLSRQYGDFVIAKAALESELNDAEKTIPKIPLWRALKPTLHEFNLELAFDFKSLAFLMEDGNDKLFTSLVHAETNYHELGRFFARHSDAASQMQHKFNAAGWTDQTTLSEGIIKNAVGGELVGELESLVHAIKNRIETKEEVYMYAGQKLEAFMRIKFKDRVFVFRALGAKAGLSKLDQIGQSVPTSAIGKSE